MVICEHCNKTLKSEKYLKRHLRDTKYCRNSRNIIVFCRKCRAVIPVRNIETHADKCKGEEKGSDDWKGELLETARENKLQKSKCEKLEEKIRKQTRQIDSLRSAMRWERLQTNVFKELVRANTNIPVDDLVEVTEEGVHIYNFSNGNVPVIVHDTIKGRRGKYKTYTLSSSDKPKKPRYQTVKNQIDLAKEENKEEKVKQVDETLEEIVQENFDVPRDKIISQIDNLFNSVESTRVYKKSLKEMCSVRSQLLGILPLEEYTELLKTHCDRLEEIFKGRHMKGKKLKNAVTKAFTPLDTRLLFYNGYYNTSVTLDDCERLKLALSVTTVHPKEYKSFKKETVFKQLQNYSIALFPLKECMKRVLVNRYGFHNLTYFSFRKSTKEDPYSFYTLEKVEKGTRFWKMECRLEDFCHDVVNGLRSYCVFLFRRIYFDIFGDNDYREDFSQNCQIMSEDCEQLLQNIYILSCPIPFRNTMKEFVMENATVQPTEFDKCHLMADDKIQQRRLKNEKENDEEEITVAKQLFDGISTENALGLWADR